MANHYEYTEGQMMYMEEQIETEFKKFKLPYITRMYKMYGYPALRYSIVPFWLILLCLFGIYVKTPVVYDWLFILCQILLYVYGSVFFTFASLSYICEKIYIRNFRYKIKLSEQDFQIFCAAYNITGL